jgi:hypothetical protein
VTENVENNKTLFFDPVMPNLNQQMNQFNQHNVSKDDYLKYGWLFGKR